MILITAHKLEGNLVITSPEDGALALAMAVIQCALHDIHLHLDPIQAKHPEHRTPAAIQGAQRESSVRRALARQAAAFLHSEDGRWWLSALEACGAPVPLHRLYRQLHRLKHQHTPA